MSETSDSLGEYVLLERLKGSRSGTIYKAKHRTMGRLVALKVLSKEASRAPGFVKRFQRKTKILAQLSHPNLVAAYEAGELAGTPYLAMEYVDGQNLSAVLKSRGPLPVEEAIQYLLQATAGLGYAHQQGIYHRNVRPSHLMVDRQRVVKVVGFGLAHVESGALEGEEDSGGMLTQQGQMIGTGEYMAPEQAVSAATADQRADVYSLGCTLHTLLTGRYPYPGESLAEQLTAHSTSPIPSLRALRPDVPEALDTVFQKMLAKRPEDRYQSMEEVATALQGCLVAAPSPPAPVLQRERGSFWAVAVATLRKRPILIGVTGIAVVGILGISLLMTGRSSTHPKPQVETVATGATDGATGVTGGLPTPVPDTAGKASHGAQPEQGAQHAATQASGPPVPTQPKVNGRKSAPVKKPSSPSAVGSASATLPVVAAPVEHATAATSRPALEPAPMPRREVAVPPVDEPAVAPVTKSGVQGDAKPLKKASISADGAAEAGRDQAGFLPMVERSHVDRRFAEFDRLNLQNMPTGDVLAKHDVRAIRWMEVNGPAVQRLWTGQQRVVLRNLALKVNWPKTTNKYSGTLFRFCDCEEVVVENVAVIHTNPDYRGQHTLLFEGCGKVTVRNCYSAGAVERVHIRLEGCRECLIERTEVSGWDYGKDGVRCGAGIAVNNGDNKPGLPPVNADHPRDLDWEVIRDCWVHDYLAHDGAWRNQDGILCQSASSGIIFNCVVDRWKVGDAAIDESHRRHDAHYQNKVHRIERCLLRDCERVKTSGGKGNRNCTCISVWANNVYINTWLGDYHEGWNNWHIHETYVFENRSPVFVKNWGIRAGLTIFANGLVVAPEGIKKVFFQSNKVGADAYRSFRLQNLVYLMPPPDRWVSGEGTEIRDWTAWLAQAMEQNCVFARNSPAFSNPRQQDFRLTAASPAIGCASSLFVSPIDVALRVSRDFYGNRRPAAPSVGAFEAVSGVGQVPARKTDAERSPAQKRSDSTSSSNSVAIPKNAPGADLCVSVTAATPPTGAVDRPGGVVEPLRADDPAVG